MNTVDKILLLINDKGISKNKMLTDLGLSKNSFVNWEKRGTSPSGETLSKIAAYFKVSTDYLLGNDTSGSKDPATDEEIKFALFNGSEGVTDEMYEEVKNFAQMVKLREATKQKGKK